VRAMVALPLAPRSIVNVASLASVLHTPDAYAYGASKRACASFSSSVAKDVLDFGIRVNTVSPGMSSARV
jgi:chanoclavine-I dehydrogenase